MRLQASDLRVKIFADGADRAGMLQLAANPLVRGFTTNPSLMRKAGVTDYVAFARDILEHIRDRPISFEVFSDDFDEMYEQARQIMSWGDNVYVKIPISNTKGESVAPLLERLADLGAKINVTAVFTIEQARVASHALRNAAPSNISIFAGRIADAGIDPLPLMREALAIMAEQPQQEMIWASPREPFNVVQAHEIGCHIITATPDIIGKLSLLGKDPGQMSLEAVQTFRADALAAGFTI